MSNGWDPARTLAAMELMRKIAEKIAAGGEFTNTDSGRAANEFFQRTRDRIKQHQERTIISAGELSFLEGIETRMKGKRRA